MSRTGISNRAKKIKYMFPKAHAVAYVMMAVRIAWFKVHRPLAYYCMFFSIRCDAYDIHTMIAGEEAIRQRMTEIRRAKEDKTQTVSDKENAIYDTLELALEMACRDIIFQIFQSSNPPQRSLSMIPRILKPSFLHSRA